MKIEEFSQIKIIYMRRIGAYGTENVELMESFKNWLNVNNLFNKDSVILGIAQDNPALIDSENCRYDVGLIVPEFDTFAELDISLGNIEDGKYAIFTLEHTEEAINKAWQSIPINIPKIGCSIDGTRPILERYSVDMVDNHLCEICVPIEQ
ncbi:DNA gyrase inhibitor [Enterococcus faecalis]|nr:DNA gyrase inhibitor [Enterococcus faecalis]EGO9344422.1 DNA gyrase inhibitor [Enterococcus faecalis]